MSNEKKVTKVIEDGKEYYVISNNRDFFYYKDKECIIPHRENGPAAEWNNGDKSWWVDGKRHREDGPAIEWSFKKRYFLNDKQYTEKEYWAIIRFGSFV